MAEKFLGSIIEYYNKTLAHPYNWTYTGKVLAD